LNLRPRTLNLAPCTLNCAPARLNVVAAVLLFIAWPAIANAQTKGRVSVGASVTTVMPSDSDVETATSVGPLVRLNPRKGWGPAFALNWFRAHLKDPAGGDADFARLRIRPVMAGVGYSIGAGDRTLVNVSVVAGWSFNRVDFDDDFLETQAGDPTIDVENSFVLRPGISMTHTLASRVAITAFGGYMFNRPDMTYRNAAGQQFENRWRADSVVLSVGVVYSLF
jgi:hypothetical protein